MKLAQTLLILTTTLNSISAFANEKLSVFIEYRHADIHVHYTLPCSYKSLCSLTSPEGAAVPWKIEITPNKLESGIISVATVIHENSREVSRSNILNKLGEEAKIVSTGPDGESSHLTIRPH